MQYKVQMSENKLGILDNDDFPVHMIDKNSLPAILKVDGAPCSECIIKLSSSSYINMQLLYKIAYHIQKNFPENEIDWFTTFYHIEKSDYLEAAFRFKALLEGVSDDIRNEDRLEEMTDFLENDPVDDVDTKILKIVMMNLICYKVITR